MVSAIGSGRRGRIADRHSRTFHSAPVEILDDAARGDKRRGEESDRERTTVRTFLAAPAGMRLQETQQVGCCLGLRESVVRVVLQFAPSVSSWACP